MFKLFSNFAAAKVVKDAAKADEPKASEAPPQHALAEPTKKKSIWSLFRPASPSREDIPAQPEKEEEKPVAAAVGAFKFFGRGRAAGLLAAAKVAPSAETSAVSAPVGIVDEPPKTASETKSEQIELPAVPAEQPGAVGARGGAVSPTLSTRDDPLLSIPFPMPSPRRPAAQLYAAGKDGTAVPVASPARAPARPPTADAGVGTDDALWSALPQHSPARSPVNNRQGQGREVPHFMTALDRSVSPGFTGTSTGPLAVAGQEFQRSLRGGAGVGLASLPLRGAGGVGPASGTVSPTHGLSPGLYPVGGGRHPPSYGRALSPFSLMTATSPATVAVSPVPDSALAIAQARVQALTQALAHAQAQAAQGPRQEPTDAGVGAGGRRGSVSNRRASVTHRRGSISIPLPSPDLPSGQGQSPAEQAAADAARSTRLLPAIEYTPSRQPDAWTLASRLDGTGAVVGVGRRGGGGGGSPPQAGTATALARVQAELSQRNEALEVSIRALARAGSMQAKTGVALDTAREELALRSTELVVARAEVDTAKAAAAAAIGKSGSAVSRAENETAKVQAQLLEAKMALKTAGEQLVTRGRAAKAMRAEIDDLKSRMSALTDASGALEADLRDHIEYLESAIGQKETDVADAFAHAEAATAAHAALAAQFSGLRAENAAALSSLSSSEAESVRLRARVKEASQRLAVGKQEHALAERRAEALAKYVREHTEVVLEGGAGHVAGGGASPARARAALSRTAASIAGTSPGRATGHLASPAPQVGGHGARGDADSDEDGEGVAVLLPRVAQAGMGPVPSQAETGEAGRAAVLARKRISALSTRLREVEQASAAEQERLEGEVAVLRRRAEAGEARAAYLQGVLKGLKRTGGQGGAEGEPGPALEVQGRGVAKKGPGATHGKVAHEGPAPAPVPVSTPTPTSPVMEGAATTGSDESAPLAKPADTVKVEDTQ